MSVAERKGLVTLEVSYTPSEMQPCLIHLLSFMYITSSEVLQG